MAVPAPAAARETNFGFVKGRVSMDEIDEGAAEPTPDEALESEVLFTWDTKAGMDLATRYLLTDTGVWEYYGISTVKGASKTLLGAASLVAALAGKGRLSLSIDRLTNVRSKAFMPWNRVTSVTAIDKKRRIDLVDVDDGEMSLRCTPEAFETARHIVDAQVAAARQPAAASPTSLASTARFCSSCGNPVAPADRFCGGCGARIPEHA